MLMEITIPAPNSVDLKTHVAFCFIRAHSSVMYDTETKYIRQLIYEVTRNE